MRTLRTNETRARRLDSLMCNLIFSAVFLALCLCALGFLATRTHMFHGALMRRQQNVLNNMWLLQQCKSPDFYSNMKQHSTLCDDVVLQQTDALWLHALRDVIDETYFCGDKPCISRRAGDCVGVRQRRAPAWRAGWQRTLCIFDSSPDAAAPEQQATRVLSYAALPRELGPGRRAISSAARLGN